MASINKNKAVFLDRDGTLIKNVPYLNDYKKIEYLPGVFNSLKSFQEKGYLLVIVTNQSGIKRGLVTLKQLKEINQKIIDDFKKENIEFEGVYFCPHLDEGCACRKPEPGMLLEASRDFDVDLTASIMIGDSERDVEAGQRAGCRDSYLVKDFNFWKSFKDAL